MASKDLLSVIEKPVHGIDVYADKRAVEQLLLDELTAVGYVGSMLVGQALSDLQKKAQRARNFIIQALNDKQITLIQMYDRENAYMVIRKLKLTYGTAGSSRDVDALLHSLQSLVKMPSDHEKIPDYFARCHSIVHDVRQINANCVSPEMNCFFILNGLGRSKDFKEIVKLFRVVDAKNRMTMDE